MPFQLRRVLLVVLLVVLAVPLTCCGLLAFEIFRPLPVDGQSRFERYTADPAPPSLVVVDSWGDQEDDLFSDPTVAVHFRLDPADLDAVVGGLEEVSLDRTPTARDGYHWFDPGSLGPGVRLFRRNADGGMLRVYVNAAGDEGFSLYLGL